MTWSAWPLSSASDQAAYMQYFFRRHVCRLEHPPAAAQYTFTHLNPAIYERMQGPNEMRITGIYKDYDLTDRLGQLSVPALFVCGRHGSTRPEDTAWYHSLVPDAELVVSEHSSHLPYLEEPEPYLQALRDFVRRAERTPWSPASSATP
jgi:proline iminopeptidase